jgi:hypothetical protein
MNKFGIQVGDEVSILSLADNFEKVVRIDGDIFYLEKTGSWPFIFLEDEMKINSASFKLNHKMNNMFEVGDLVQTTFGPSQRLITRIGKVGSDGNYKVYYQNSGQEDWGWASNYTLVSKAKKGEITGYKLLKDLPGIKAGKVSDVLRKDEAAFYFPGMGSGSILIKADKLLDTEWFEPMYKPTETILKISENREVLIEKDKATIKGVDSMSLLEVKYLYDVLNPVNKLGKHTMTITQDSKVKVGCQTFTKQDINTVYNSLSKM